MWGFRRKAGDAAVLTGKTSTPDESPHNAEPEQSTSSSASTLLGKHPIASEHGFISKLVISDALMMIDACLILLSAVAAKWIYIGTVLKADQGIEAYAAVGAVGAIGATLLFKTGGLYKFEVLNSMRGQARRILFGLFMTALFLVAIGYMLKISEQYSRGWFGIWFASAAILTLTTHLVAVRVLRWWGKLGLFARNVAIYGSNDIAEALIRKLTAADLNMRVVGVFDDFARGEVPAVPVRGGLSDLISFGQKHRIDEVLIALPLADGSRIANLVGQLSLLPVDIRLCPSAMEFRVTPKALFDYRGLAVLELEPRPMDGWGPIVKTVEDRLLSTSLLLVLAPLLLLIALVIKLDSRGPVIFRQRRHGFNHEVFSLYKFRTMYVAEDGSVVQAVRGDPRVTRFGRFLRRTSLDELPQLVNVLRGEMSLVGPRPHALSHNEYYSALLEQYAARHKVKPGMTGWAQINGYRGETDMPEKMRRRVEHDLYYIENWSVWFDFKIMLLTPLYGFVGRNAF